MRQIALWRDCRCTKSDGDTLRILSAGIDWQSANVEIRGVFGFTGERVAELLKTMRGLDGVLGCALLSTCNRCEVFFSVEPGTWLNPAQLLCDAAGLDAERYARFFVSANDDDAAERLFEIACGLRSQILGEEQILTQLRTALSAAREVQTADAVLQTLFRLAITAGKEARTRVRLTGVPTSVAEKAIIIAEERLGKLLGLRAVVIGNGEMGRLTASLLRERGCSVTVTLRSYRHGETLVPDGCDVVNYDERASAIDGSDLLCSATTSPHFTVSTALLSGLTRRPRMLIDLAVPCDIEQSAAELPDTIYLNMDGITNGDVGEHNAAALEKTAEIISKHHQEFYRWARYREEKNTENTPRFPLFVSLEGRRCVIVGGGQVACRRVEVLRRYGASITVIAPEIRERIDGVIYLERDYIAGDLRGAFLAVAATDSRAVNAAVTREAVERGAHLSVADSPADCTFWFPASCLSDTVSAGVVSRDGNHARAAEAARMIREAIN